MTPPDDPFVAFQVVPESGHQNFTVVALTRTGRLLACYADWQWFDITPGESDGEEAGLPSG